MFIGRKDEMRILNEIASSNRAELVLMYGRRRVGKSTILTKFARDVGGQYLLADASKNILEILSGQIEDEFVRFDNWETFFKYIIESKNEIFIIDEFQYIYNNNKAWPTILQRWWEKIKETKKKIILCGSIISTIHKVARGYGSALYGRKTREILVEPFDIRSSFKFLDGFDNLEKLTIYSWVGGVPRYLEEMESNRSLKWNVENRIIEKTSYLYNEPMNLLFEEFRDPAPYVSIIGSIINGMDRFSEISEYSHIAQTKLPKYLTTLQRVKIIDKIFPVTEKRERSKNTKYRICDNFFKFWFKYVFPNRSRIEIGRKDQVRASIFEYMEDHLGRSLEDICLDLALKDLGPDWLVGKWWHKEHELDLLALNRKMKKALVGEVKWNPKKLNFKILEEMDLKIEMIDDIKGYEVQKFLISRDLEKMSSMEGVDAIDVFDLIDGRAQIV